MKFGSVGLTDAIGAILAHSITVPGGRVPKGSVLTEDHIAQLKQAGIEDVVVARLDSGDVDENTAAQRLAHALAPHPDAQGVRISAAGAGRVNLYAAVPGVVHMNTDAIERMNTIDPMITFATLPQWTRVDVGTMVGTIKIISYSVTAQALDAAIRAAQAAMKVVGAVHTSVTLIETCVGDSTPTFKGRDVTAERVARFGMHLTDRVLVPHSTGAIAKAIAEAQGDMVLILTASATSDPNDVAPEGVRQAGGHVEAYGMPVDPGNLLFFGSFENKPVIGLPGCARSPALNGADWVLERLACGIGLTQSDIQQMGVGGLLKEIPTRPRPRAQRP